MKIPQEVIDHCNKYKMCYGCPFECVAPTTAYDSSRYQTWIKNVIDKILNLYV